MGGGGREGKEAAPPQASRPAARSAGLHQLLRGCQLDEREAEVVREGFGVQAGDVFVRRDLEAAVRQLEGIGWYDKVRGGAR